MATPLISIEEYLNISAKPGCEYVRGVIKRRAVPEYDHAAWQEALLAWFREPGAPHQLLFSSAGPKMRVPYPCAAVAQGWATTKAGPVVVLAGWSKSRS